MSLTGPLVQETAWGWHVRRDIVAEAKGTIDVVNKSGETAPVGAFVEVYDQVAGPLYYFRKPTGNNLDNVYIITTELANDDQGEAWDRGITGPAEINGTPSPGDLVGSTSGQWYGTINADGTHVAVADDYVSI